MNFRRGSFREEPEINLVPFIDVLIVIVIFLAVTTTYSRYSEMQINLPTADATKPADRPNQINVGVSANGQYMINRSAIAFTTALECGIFTFFDRLSPSGPPTRPAPVGGCSPSPSRRPTGLR